MVNLNRTVADVIDTNIPHWAALTAVTTDAENGAYAPGVTTGTLTVTLHEDEDVRSWLNQEGATDPNDKLEGAYAEYACSTVLGASMDGGKTIIPLYIAPDGSQMVGKLEFPVSTEESVTHVVEFFELQDGNPITSGEGEDAKPVPFFGIYTSFVAQQAVFLGEDDVTFTTPADWPEDGQRVFGDQLTAPFTLSFTVVDQSATWKDTSKVTIRDSEGKLVDEDAHFLWESSNPQVATINEKGEITILTNGAVSFTLTALNGNVEKAPADPPQEATTYACTYATPEILVGVGNSPFLTVPESLRTTTVRGGQPTTVLWSSNLTEKNRDNAAGVEDLDSVETTFTLTLYNAGQFNESAGGPKEGAQGVVLDPVVSSMKDVKSSALIPADKIPYANGEPYYVTISTTDNATGKPYTSWAKIEVQSPPAVVELARPSSLYITDEVDTLPLTWSLANFNGDGKEFRLVITNNTTSAVQGTDVNAGNQSGSFTMNIADVANGYRDTYTVEVAAKNATDSTWSYDSFVLYVYDRVALQQFVVDGEDTANGSAITLSNGEKEYIQKLIDSQNSTAAQQAVWDTGRDISLTADVSMDPDKPWLEVPDQFAWSAEDTTTASGTGQTHATLNYQQGALYEDITRYQRTSYGPTAEFRLSGLSDGTTKVTAEHVNTGTVAELIVNVDTLQDKLFLFQFTPAVETALRYTNGDGVQKEVTSMADGRAAIYEESGIQGDVYLESQQGDTEYFGTLYNENLVSSEKDSTQLEDTKASYVQWNGASFGEEDIHAFPDPAGTDEGEGEGADAQANQESIQGGDNQLRLAGTNNAAIAAWTRVTETLAKEPGSAVTEDEQLLMMNSSEILASVWDGTQWATTRLTQNSSADMAPVVAVGGGKALVAWRAVAASDSGAPTEFDSYDTIQYKVYDFNTEKWSGPYTLYNGTSGAVKGMEAQMTESGAMAVAYTIEKGSTSSTTRAVTLEDSTTVVPTLQNNSIQQKTSGYLIVDLLDESRNVIASQQTYTLENGTPTGLIQLDGEGVATVQPITFKQKGAGVAYRFGESQTEASTGLTEIALSQIPLRMEDGVEAEGTTTFQVTADASLTETTLTVLQEYLPATVTVNGKPYDVNDIASRTFSLPVGTTTLDMVVTSGDKTHTYRVEITRPSTGGGTGGGGSTRYPITVPEEDHGTVSVSPSRASSGQTVTITVTPDEGYKVGSVTVKRPNGSTVPVTGQGNGKYTFTMPSGGIAVDVTFIPEDWPFVDVTEDKWYYDAVAYVYQQGIMVGMSETTFEPNTTVNRAQVVQMLYNLEGQPQVSGDSGFSDIRDDQWYAKAVAWASANDVVAGYEDGTFRPTRAVTREEFAQILYNYAKFKWYDLSASADLGKFPDSGQVSSWAEIALGWANGNGLINGHDDGRLDPKGSTIRAQAASILMNFDKGFAQEG